MRKVATKTAKTAGITAIGQRLLRPKDYLLRPLSPHGHFAIALPIGQQGPPQCGFLVECSSACSTPVKSPALGMHCAKLFIHLEIRLHARFSLNHYFIDVRVVHLR